MLSEMIVTNLKIEIGWIRNSPNLLWIVACQERLWTNEPLTQKSIVIIGKDGLAVIYPFFSVKLNKVFLIANLA